MSQNLSTAVMQRRVEPQDSLDDFPTPPWATRAALRFLAGKGVAVAAASCREPCANRGYMVRPLEEAFHVVHASDVFDYGAGYPVRDYLFGLEDEICATDWTFMNPPFRLATEFIQRALRRSRVGVAAIVRTSFLEGIERYETLYKVTPPWVVAQHVERVPMVKGRYDPEATTATSYSWLFWRTDTTERLPVDWIPPCRRQLERASDYPVAVVEADASFVDLFGGVAA